MHFMHRNNKKIRIINMSDDDTNVRNQYKSENNTKSPKNTSLNWNNNKNLIVVAIL